MPDREIIELREEIATLKAQLSALEQRAAERPAGRLGRAAAKSRLRLGFAAALTAIPLAAYAAQVSLPNSFTGGTIADANQVNANFDALLAESNTQDLRIAALEAAVPSQEVRLAGVESQVTINTSDIATNQTSITGNASAIADSNAAVAPLLLAPVTCASQVGNEVFFDGCNVNIVSGSGSTAGAVNGLGNLIVGYNENSIGATRTGSHNIVVGPDHEYTSYANIISGSGNVVSQRSEASGVLRLAMGD
jgi:hypothetical protein